LTFVKVFFSFHKLGSINTLGFLFKNS